MMTVSEHIEEEPQHGTVSMINNDTPTVQQSGLEQFITKYRIPLMVVGIIVAIVGIHVYLYFAIEYNFKTAIALIVFLSLGWAAAVWYIPVKYLARAMNFDSNVSQPVYTAGARLWNL